LPVLLLVSPVFVLLIALGASAIASHALRPIEDLAAAAEHVTARELSQRLPEVQADEEIKRLTRVLNRMMERLETSFRQVERFTSDASHELKTPLTIIHGQLETALRTLHFSEEQEELLLSTLQEVRRLSRIVDNLLLLSRSDAGRLELTAEILDLSAMVEELREDADVLGADSDLRVEAEVEADVRVKADPAYLRQLLLNLLDNACKYNKRGGVVRFHLGVENRQAVFRIGNTGNDIPSEQQTRLFERFFRGDPARQRTTEGSGLGLSISREIARAHGGEVVLARSDWEWTEFVLTLPIASGTIALPRIETPSERAAETHSATAVESVTARSC
jgi:heavy metal sensor kinase